MSRKQFLKPYQLITSGDMSQASIISPVTDIQGLDNVGYQVNFTGAPVGTFSVEVSMDYQPGTSPNSPPANAGNWIPVTLSTPVTASGSPDNAYIDLALLSAPYIRLKYTKTSGTGSLNAFIVAKAI